MDAIFEPRQTFLPDLNLDLQRVVGKHTNGVSNATQGVGRLIQRLEADSNLEVRGSITMEEWRNLAIEAFGNNQRRRRREVWLPA